MFRILLRSLPILAIAIVGTVRSADAPVKEKAANWPVFRANAEMTGSAVATLPEQLQELWTFKTGNAIEGAPAIVDGVVYVASTDKHVYALDLKTGKQRWKTAVAAPIKASPGVRNNRVYVGDSDGKLHCFNATDGKLVWTFETMGEIVAGVNFHKENILLGSHDSTLYCVSAEGKKVWEFKIDGPVNGTPAVKDDMTFVAGCDSILHVVDANTGKEIRNVEIGGQAGATAALIGNEAFVGTMSNQMIAIDVKNGKKLWTFEAMRRQQPFYSSAAVSEKLVVVGNRDKKIYALDRETGQERWSYLTDGNVDGSPIIVGNRVYVGCLSSEGQFYVLDLKTGNKVQVLNLDSEVTGSPAVSSDCLLVGTDKGTLYCLGSK